MKSAAAITAVIVLLVLAALGAAAGGQPVINLMPAGAQPAAETVAPLAAKPAVLVLDALGGMNPARLLLSNELLLQSLLDPEQVPAAARNGAAASCWGALTDPGFEAAVPTGWQLPATEFSARFSTEQAFAGNQSLKTGITDAAQNTYSFSSGSQPVTIPANATAATLRFRLYPLTSEPSYMSIPEGLAKALSAEATMVGDAQWVLLLNQRGQEIARLVSMRSNSASWGDEYAFDLLPYAGQTIRVYFGTFNNGYGGVTAMYVDEANVEICSPTPPAATATPTTTAVPTNTATATNTPTATNTAQPTATATATSTPLPTNTATATYTPTPLPPLVCEEGVQNNSFENQTIWRLPSTEFSAAYSQEQARSGVWSMRTGIVDPQDNVYSFSSVLQTVVIPANVTVAELTFYLYPQTSESPNLLIPATLLEAMSAEATAVGDAQWVIIFDANGNELARPVTMRSNSRTWELYTVDLLPFAGKTIQLYFGTFNNGWDGVTAMFVDDVHLDLCTGFGPTATTTPTATAEATATATATATPTPVGAFALPVVLNDAPQGISGRVIDGQGLPLALAVVGLDSGASTSTDADGYYNFSGLAAGSYVIAPQVANYVCRPAQHTAVLPPSAGELDFVCRPAAYP